MNKNKTSEKEDLFFMKKLSEHLSFYILPKLGVEILIQLAQSMLGKRPGKPRYCWW